MGKMSKWALEADEKEEFKISEEGAEKCVREFIRRYHIDVERLDEKIKAAAESAFEVMSDGYRRGLLENKDDEKKGFCVLQHVKANGQTLEYRELCGRDKRAMDGYDSNILFERQQALLGKLCGGGADVIGSLKGIDLQIAEALGSAFFMS